MSASDSSDIQPSRNKNENRLRKDRKCKNKCKELLSTSLGPNSDSDDYEESEYDSDVDPEFKYSDDSDEMDLEDASENVESDDSDESIYSNNTEFDDTINILNLGYKIPNKHCGQISAEDLVNKQSSQRKISEECLAMLGEVQNNIWNQNYNVALEQAFQIIKKYPSYHGAYDLLAQIYAEKGNTKKASELFHAAVLCNTKDTDSWLQLINDTTSEEGINKAIEITKFAMSRNNSLLLRKLFVTLLEQGGYEKEAMKKKLSNIEQSPAAKNQYKVNEVVSELFSMSEKFEQLKDFKRSTKCLELIDSKYPNNLSDEQRIRLLQLMVKFNRFHGIFDVAGRITGVIINKNCPINLISFTNEITIEDRHQIIFAILYATIHLEIIEFIVADSFLVYLKELLPQQDQYLIITNKMYICKYYKLAMTYLQYLIDNTDDKLAALKLFGKCQEALGMDDNALNTYDYIINEINGKDASVWELKANLLYRLQREDDAIYVLAESQKFINTGSEFIDITNRCKPTKDSLQLLYKLCEMLYTENRFHDFINVAWKFLFIDSFEFFQKNKIEICCDSIAIVKPRIHEIQNSIWLCISKTLDSNGQCILNTNHIRGSESSSTWKIFEKLLKLLSQSSNEDYSDVIELLAQWGLVLQKILNWNSQLHLELSAIYVSIALKNRLKKYHLRREISSNMIFKELRWLRNKFGEKNQFWNLIQIYCQLMEVNNYRFILRCLSETKNKYPLELINAGNVLAGNVKLSLAINNKFFSEDRNNPQIALHMAITFVNTALSRTVRDPVKPVTLALLFIHEYHRLRGDCQEAFYNLGRFYHRINYEDFAIGYYHKCLSTPAIGNSDYEKSLTDLSKEAAFNLIHIYRGSQNENMVGYLTRKYLII